ncbi:MAG: DUF3025 domain-containing protein [Gallionella sp.]|nr:DUF3025 domain-containing protein [Gallionella sp.]MDD4946518.1 DUF3025 domain-containing protein [Gallionella sp.]
MKPDVAWDKQALLDAPLFAPLFDAIAALGADGFPTLEALNALLDGHGIAVEQGHVLHFVEQGVGRLAFEAQYEPRCYLTGGVQTRRDNWHDLLNALVWRVFPKSKAAINVRHYRALTGADAAANTVNVGGGSQRGAVRDTNTLLDESGVIVACADVELAGLLRDFRWKELFWQRREQVQGSASENPTARMGFYLFGHGLYEKALNPYIGMTGQGLLLPVAPEFFGWQRARQLAHLDGLLADYLANPDHCRSTRELSPVPLLGVPGWAVQDADFYDNTAYFRPGRRSAGGRSPGQAA